MGEIRSCVTKTGGLGYAYTGAKRSAVLYRGKYRYIYGHELTLKWQDVIVGSKRFAASTEISVYDNLLINGTLFLAD